MAEQGYLFMRGLLSRATVQDVRTEILALCAEAGWLRPGGEAEGLVDVGKSCQPPDPRYYAVYNKLIALESYNRLAHAPELTGITSMIIGHDDVIPRPVRLARLVFPQPDVGATPPHQDFPHEQGTPEAITVWIPIGDVPRAQGGLAVWPGSQRNGVYDHGFVPGVGGLGLRTDGLGPRWHSADFQAGDVILFHSLTVHKALPNRTVDRLRISADFRYQRASEPMTPHMLEPSGGSLSWQDVYSGWSSDDLKYYWSELPIRTVPYDRRFYRVRDEQAIELARRGDPHAREFLNTIRTRNPDPTMRAAAGELLDRLAAAPGAARSAGEDGAPR
ncbi:phytanoyl-CoA dioxygenase family protein [Micromonospora tulbaghiae]